MKPPSDGTPSTATTGPRTWAVTHLAPAARWAAGRRPSGVSIADSTLAPPFAAVTLRSYRPATLAKTESVATGSAARGSAATKSAARGSAATGSAAAAAPARAAIVYFAPSAEFQLLRQRTGEWLCGSLARRLGAVVVRVAVGAAVVDVDEAAYQAVRWAASEHPDAQLAVLGTADGASLAARAAMIARDENSRDELRVNAQGSATSTPHLERQALIEPVFSLIAGPPVTAEALATSLVARLSELPPTLLQRPSATSAQLGDENLAVLLREAGVAVREIEYSPTSLSWASYPRAVAHSGRALNDLEAFFRRGLIDDGFDVVPAWNVH